MGWEVKSMRAGKAQIAEAYVYLKAGKRSVPRHHQCPQFRLHPMSIPAHADPQDVAQSAANWIIWWAPVERRGYTIVPLELYWKEGRAKLEIALPKARSSTTSATTERTGMAARQGRIMKASRR